MSKLGVALLGLDHWYVALGIAPALAQSDTVRLVAVSHDDGAKADKVARDYGAERATTDFRAALDHPGVDIVVAQYSTDRNVEICRAAAQAGKHIVSVKPMAMDLAGADAIVEAVNAAGVHLLPFESMGRLGPEGQRTKTWLDEGRIGRPLRFSHTLHGSLPQSWPGSDDSGWWVDPARVPGGGWLDHAIYAIDTLRWLFGSEPVEARGVAFKQRYPELAVEDYGAATFTLANGAVALIEDTWTADRGYGFSRSEITGSAGAIVGDVRGGVMLRGEWGLDGWVTVEGRRAAGQNVVEHLAACVRGEQAPVASAADGRANLAACLAFYQAAREGSSVRI